MKPLHNSPRRHAFTLLEVLVALMVFALAAVALGAAYVNVLNAYAGVRRGDLSDEDARFARQRLLLETDRKKAEEGGDFDSAAGGRVLWRAQIESTETADLYAVTFTCEMAGATPAGPTRTVTEHFMLLRPTWSEGVDVSKLRQQAKERILALREKREP